jgi:Family of unknown function (DUF6345)/FlgD Ig-like domain/Bacterial Ig domain
MKNIKCGLVGMVAAIAMIFGGNAKAQTNLDFTSITPTVEGAMGLTWNSTSNEIYEIDEADALNTNSDGTTAWNMLYSDYPSQGTNTFWLDTGNYFSDPEIVHPSQSPMRFYRVLLTGTNTTTSVPLVSISSPTNGTSANGTLTVMVNASTDQAFLNTKLYVDGQEMQEADISTNYTSSGSNFVTDTYLLNSCEWPNGPHTLFATACCQSGASGTHDVPDVGIGYGVSQLIPVSFSNLITRISFSQPFFAPEDGTTQLVTAIFAANVNWTLQIQDVNTNTVLTVTNSGGSMSYTWDGTGQGGTNLPVGTYTYLITAETNGAALSSVSVGGGGGGSGPPSPDFARAPVLPPMPTIWYAAPADGSRSAVPAVLYPPGMDTNGLVFFEAPVTPVIPQRESVTPAYAFGGGGGGFTPDYSGGSNQTSRAPVRPPINPVKGRAGIYGVAYQTYSANGSGFTIAPPDNGLHIGIKIGMEGHTPGTSTFLYGPLTEYKREANNFISQMKKANWSQGFAKVDDKLAIGDLRSSGANVFNTVKLGLLLLHGTYGTTIDYSANQAKQMYFPITSGHTAQYIGMAEMQFGSSATNGLKWMAIAACDSLLHTDWSSMATAGVQPYNGNLHLILGADAVIWTGDHVASYWAKYMTVGKTPGSPMTIQAAWYAGAQDAYAETKFSYTNTMNFAASGDAACVNDYLQTNTAPGGSSFYSSVKVYPLP